MAGSGTRKTQKPVSRTAKSSAKKTARTAKPAGKPAQRKPRGYSAESSFIPREIAIIVLFAATVFLFLCNFGIMGSVGDFFSRLLFGLFGLPAYILPVLVLVLALFAYANREEEGVVSKIAAIVLLLLVIGIICELTDAEYFDGMKYSMKEIYLRCAEDKSGGGLFAGSIAFALYSMLKLPGTILVLLVLTISSLVLLSRRSFIDVLQNGARRVGEGARAAHENARERQRIRSERYAEAQMDETVEPEDDYYPPYDDGRDAYDDFYSQEDAVFQETAKERLMPQRRREKVSGVAIHTFLEREPQEEAAPEPEQPAQEVIPQFRSGDMHEIHMTDGADDANGFLPYAEGEPEYPEAGSRPVIEPTVIREPYGEEEFPEDPVYRDTPYSDAYYRQEPAAVPAEPEPAAMPAEPEPAVIPVQPEPPFRAAAREDADRERERTAFSSEKLDDITVHSERVREEKKPELSAPQPSAAETARTKAPAPARKLRPHEYVFPKIDLLKKGDRGRNAASELELKETALRLEETLRTFGVNVTITDISQGPAVTRYELLPDQGVKVSRIVSLQDDIKMHLAATDIRIEAPIPGKAAIGIEVPNRENSIVTLRDILETPEYKQFKSNLVFPVGKDIAGQPVVFDIAKMPHVLIAGSTGSGKSVCINTIIMGILYKAKPEDVKLIMVDPKIVELSVYNGIPHLMIPVVTEPKKAAAALNWAVAEMNERYKKFADAKVRDLKGYNELAGKMQREDLNSDMKPMPQLVIIVDELADLMMVSANEVEEAICRLAQLARAAGIHLIIATQRPSVDVITGLIKANMPSRVAFAVTSGVDSRTILDMVGAEKLLGKGDMLFYPQGYVKPTRIQGAFVSDGEVADVVAFIKERNPVVEEENEVQRKIDSFSSGQGAPGSSPSQDSDSGMDEFFVEAGRFIIEKDKASIGLLQRRFKIGFNRAARIMDQLCDAGVVSGEEGTKARQILMNAMEFENYVSENGL